MEKEEAEAFEASGRKEGREKREDRPVARRPDFSDLREEDLLMSMGMGVGAVVCEIHWFLSYCYR